MTYYDDLVNDKKRVSAFKKAIDAKANGITYDLGTGSGILATIASENADIVYAIESNPLILKKTRSNFKDYDNINLIKTDATCYEFREIPDTIICEMLDTALIDEEQIPVINNAHKYSNNKTIFIPQGVKNTIKLTNSKINCIQYYEDGYPKHEVLSDEVEYSTIDFTQINDENVDITVKLKATKDGIINSVMITTYTHLCDDLTIGPTPMLNPPLIIPVNHIDVKKDDVIDVHLKYIMGGGLNTIQTTIMRN